MSDDLEIVFKKNFMLKNKKLWFSGTTAGPPQKYNEIYKITKQIICEIADFLRKPEVSIIL